MIERLIEGNRRFRSGTQNHPGQDTERMTETAGGQNPFAVVICCSDSRVPPEIIFDQGIGDIFVIRTAGNILSDIGIGSVEYAVLNLGVELVVVLGHSRCGAIGAALSGTKPGGCRDSVIEALEPAISGLWSGSAEAHDMASRRNVRLTVEQIRNRVPSIGHLVEQGGLEIVGAYYDLDTGHVELPIKEGDVS